MRRKLLTISLAIFASFTPLLGDDLAAQTFTNVFNAGFLGSNQASWAAVWADFDGDGYIDVITTGHYQTLTRSITQLWKNNGNGTFSDVTDKAGLGSTKGDAHGAAWCDLNNDGYIDLFIAKGTLKTSPASYQELWLNKGDGTFANIASTSDILGIGHRGRGVYCVDFNLDGNLDLFVTAEWKQAGDGGNILYQNDGALSFTDVAPAAGLTREGAKNRTAEWADFNKDGFIDVFLTNPCGLFLNQGDGTFTDVTAASSIDASLNSAGAALGDYDNDGDLDIYVTMEWTEDGRNLGILYRNNGDGTFTDVTTESGILNEFDARGASWGDYDNDGYLDLYIANTNNERRPHRLFRNNSDGTFTDVALSSGLEAQLAGAGMDVTFVDYNNDGFLDIFLTNGQGNTIGPYILYRNNRNGNSWVKINLEGTRSNRSGIGSKVIITAAGKVQMREYNGFSHHMSQNHTPVHFGLGQASVVDSITIQWPSGITQTLKNVPVNRSITVVEKE
jgi:hypothetical protein